MVSKPCDKFLNDKMFKRMTEHFVSRFHVTTAKQKIHNTYVIKIELRCLDSRALLSGGKTWYKIRTQDGITGYARGDFFKKTEDKAEPGSADDNSEKSGWSEAYKDFVMNKVYAGIGEPDYYIGNVENFYDRKALSDYINSLF